MTGRTDESEAVEFQLGGTHLVAGAIAVVALCAASFLLGRWWERAQRPEVAAPAGFFEEVPAFAGPADSGDSIEAEEEVGESLTFYENLSSGRSAPDPDRSSSPPPAATGDSFVVQVLATQNAAAARRLADRLEARKFPVRIAAGRDGAGNQVYRVRVGPFRTRGLAEEAAGRLQAEEKLSTWVRIPE